MPSQEFHSLLQSLRRSSRWPESPDFASRVGISFGGYRKYESGERLPSQEALDRILSYALVDESVAAELRSSWVEAKARQAGISPSAQEKVSVDVAKLAEHLKNEVLYVLKQDGIHPQERTRLVLLNRILILLKSKLEE